MAKTILEDISAFLAQQTSWVAGLPYDIQRLYQHNSDSMVFIKEQIQESINKLDNSIYEILLNRNDIEDRFNDFVIEYNKTLTSLKAFIASHKGEYLIEIKKINTRLDKEHNWVVKELTGAAADRVDIRQELGYEISKRRAQDNVLNSKIESEILDRIDKQEQLKSDLEGSIATTNLNISTLDAKISTETTQRASQISAVTQAIANEAVARNDADLLLQTNIDALNSSLTIEQATRLANDTQLQTLINSNKTSLQNSISEVETRRISDLSILAARDNLEEDESKKRDYLVYKNLKDVFTDPTTGPIRTYNNGVYDWDTLDTSTSASNTTSVDTSRFYNKHGYVPILARKTRALAKTLLGAEEPTQNPDGTFGISGSRDNVGLDYWKGSKLQTNEGTFQYKDRTTFDIMVVNGNTLEIANDFDILDIHNGYFEIDTSTNTISANSVQTMLFNSCKNLSISTSTVVGSEGNMSATYFNGTATRALYADLAERYEADSIYEPGTILAIGGDKEVTLFQPGMPLAGVVSTNPAFRMNDKTSIVNDLDTWYDTYNPFIALKGRIPVKCHNEITKGQYVLAYANGMALGFNKSNLPDDWNLKYIGIALSNSIDNIVEVKV